ncbi:hypothetical protein JHK85_054609 [Glycine max]|nr:hypothetical protein JHK85_054609 [Glycine max]
MHGVVSDNMIAVDGQCCSVKCGCVLVREKRKKVGSFGWWGGGNCHGCGSSDTANSWTAIKTASRVAEEAGWKRVLQRELGGGDNMGTNLHQVLGSLCLNTHWNYAIFWKLKHRARMILTWEDAYYNNPDDFDSSENKHCQKTLEQIGCGKFSHSALGLAVAKMSYHAYSLGEGLLMGGSLSFLLESGIFPGYENPFIIEKKNLIVFFSFDIPGSSQIQGSLKSSSQLDKSKENFSSDIMRTCFYDTQKSMKSETADVLMPLQCSGTGRNCTPPSACEKMSDNVAKQEGPELYNDESSILLQSISNMMNVDCQEFEEMKPLYGTKYEGGSSGCKDMRLESEKNVSSFLNDFVTDNASFNDVICPSEKVRVDSACFPSVFLDTVVCESDKLHYADINQKGAVNFAQPSEANSQQHIEKSKFHTEPCYKDIPDFQTEPCYKDASHILKFPAGCELHEALGPAFLKGGKCLDWPAQINQEMKSVEMSDEISTSQLTSESCPEHLLEAMLANFSHSNNDVNSELSFCKSKQSAIVSAKNHEASIHNVHTINSEGYSIDQLSLVREDKHHSLSSSSGICGVMSSKGISSTFHSSNSGQLERSSEPSKNSKKRARPGESCRPRPRDRQLIQDRIKELRELVPNGAKCSIDSLLERTIKHMLFLQSITKHADKLTDFSDTKSKLHHKEADILGSSSYEQGSSWAMEVGGHLKVHSILVENLSKNGQMLVEGQNKRNVHRLDILWPLVQILQSKSTVYSH